MHVSIKFCICVYVYTYFSTYMYTISTNHSLLFSLDPYVQRYVPNFPTMFSSLRHYPRQGVTLDTTDPVPTHIPRQWRGYTEQARETLIRYKKLVSLLNQNNYDNIYLKDNSVCRYYICKFSEISDLPNFC